MNPPEAFCERCGAPLPGIDAVCPRCDQELATPEVSAAAGKYRCPACAGRFDQPLSVWLPRDAPWYWPQRAGEECPHCSTLLRDRRRVHHSRGELALVWLLILAASVSPWRPWAQVVVGLVYILIAWVRWRKIRRTALAEEDRFGPG